MREPPLFMRRGRLILAAAMTAFISGCAVQPSAIFPPSQAAQAKVSGRVMGGAVPISNAAVTLFSSAAGTPSLNSSQSGPYTGAANELGATLTDSNGNFAFSWGGANPAAPTCTVGQILYLTAEGGGTGLGLTNVNIVNAAVLGIAADSACDLYQSQSLSSTTALTSTNTDINEVTTVATAYAFNSFLSLTGSYNATVVNITAPAANSNFLGSSAATNDVSSGVVSTASGLQHAFYNYVNLVNPLTSQANAAPPGNASAIAPGAVVNEIANILQYCTNSVSTSGSTPGDESNCGYLYAYTPNAYTEDLGAIYPSSTLGAALNLATNPWVSATNVSDLYSLAPGTGAVPYAPALSAAPNDWTLAIAYPVPPNPVGGIGFPFMLALDADDNVYVASPENDVWMANSSGQSTASSLSACLFGWTSYGAFRPTITAYSGTPDSAPQTSNTGTEGSGTPGTSSWFCSGKQNGDTNDAYLLAALAADNAGNLWISNYGNTSATRSIFEINVNPTVSSPTVGNYKTKFSDASPAGSPREAEGIAVDKNNNVWYDDLSGSNPNLFAASSAANETIGSSDPDISPAGRGLAFDSEGNAWVAAFGGTSGDLGTLSNIGGEVEAVPLPSAGSQSSNLSNYESTSLVKVPVLGGSATASSGNNGPYGVAADGYGNIWVTAGGTNTCGSANTSGCVGFQTLSSNVDLGLAECVPGGSGGNYSMPYTSAGTSCTSVISAASGTSPKFLESDGNNVIWMMDSYNVGVEAYASQAPTPALISEPTGFTPCIPSGSSCTYPDTSSSPKGIVVDSTGSVWYTTPDITTTRTNANMLIQIIGTGTSTWPLLAVQQPGYAPY